MANRRSLLKPGARSTLFLVSYTPLFTIMIFSQLYKNWDHLIWGGINSLALQNFFKYFGVSTLLIALLIYGGIGIGFLFSNIEQRTRTNGMGLKIIDIENKNSESITYLFTYIIPFVFQDLSSLVDVVSILIIMSVTYKIYSNSTMILINPVISMFYALYSIEYVSQLSTEKRKALVLTREKFLQEGDKGIAIELGHKLFYIQTQGS